MNNRVFPVTDLEKDDTDSAWPNNNYERKGSLFHPTSVSWDLPSHGSQRSLHSPSVGRRGSVRREFLALTVEPDDVTEVPISIEEADDVVKFVEAKEITQSMSVRRRYRKSVRNRETNIVNRISGWKAFKLRVAMSWKSTTSAISEWSRDYELWKGHLKEVEGRFGSGVTSFFVFLKQLFFLNILTFMLEFGLVSLPTILIDTDIASQASTNSCRFDEYQNASNSEDTTVAQMAGDFISGRGWVNTTLMFYAGYPAATLKWESGVEYNLPLAYLLVGLSYFLVSLLLVLRSLSKGLETIFSERVGKTSYSNKIFAGWDYCISDIKAAKIKSENFVQSIRADIAEEERLKKVKTRSTKKKCHLYTLRCFTSLLVFGLLGGAIYAIYITVTISTDRKYQQIVAQEDRRLVQLLGFAPSLTITILNVVLPIIFNILCRFEDWNASFEVSINLFRAVVLKLASIVVLMITLYVAVEESCTKEPETCCQQNWENQIASQMYMLIWTDFFAHLFSSLVVNVLWKLLHKHTECFKKVGLPTFDIAKQVLGLVYGECLIWIGTFFSPILPAMGVVKLFILFYADKVSVMYSNKPSEKAYRASSSSYLFTLLLLISFFMCFFAVGWGISRLRPSCLGPFSDAYCREDARMFLVLTREVDTWPGLVRKILLYVTTATFLIPIMTVICLLLFYFKSRTKSLLDMIEVLKDQLALEGKDKRVLMEKLAKYEIMSTGGKDEISLMESEEPQKTIHGTPAVSPKNNPLNF